MPQTPERSWLSNEDLAEAWEMMKKGWGLHSTAARLRLTPQILDRHLWIWLGHEKPVRGMFR